MHIHSYLAFDGRCEEAMAFYEKVLGGAVQGKFIYGDSPMAKETPPEWHGKIMHCGLKIGDNLIMGSDAPPNGYRAPQGISISIGIAEPAEAERIFHALAEGANVTMPIQETFWAKRFGMLVDRFGIPWMINCEKPM